MPYAFRLMPYQNRSLEDIYVVVDAVCRHIADGIGALLHIGKRVEVGHGIGIYSSIQDTAKKFAKIDKVYNPNPENREVYDCLILKYKTFIEATKGYTKELSRIK